MGGYVVNFTVYTMAMVGLICFAVFVYKKIMDGGLGRKSTKFLSIEDTLNLNPRKTLHVIKAGNEKFLIASDVDRTTLISRLGVAENPNPISSNINLENIENSKEENFGQELNNLSEVAPSNKKKKIHLDPINISGNKVVGISNIRKARDRRSKITEAKSEIIKSSQDKEGNKQTKDFDVILPNSVPTMREMAKKINEL